VQYTTLHCTTVQYSTVQYSTVQYSTVQLSSAQYSTVQYSTVQYSTVQHSTVQYTLLRYTTLLYLVSTITQTSKNIVYIFISTHHIAHIIIPSSITSHHSRDMRRNKSFTGSSSGPHSGPAVGIPLGIATGDIKSVQSASESTTHPLAVRFTSAPVKEKETSDVIANLLKAFQVDEKVTQPSVNTQDISQKKIRSVSVPAGRPSIQGSTGTGTSYQGVPPCLRGTKTLTKGGAEVPLGEGFNPGYAVTPVNMRSNPRFASSSEESSLGTTSNKCSASTSGTTSPYESNSMNVGKYSGRGYVSSSSIGNALKNLNMNNQHQNNNNDTLSENARKLQNLIPKCLSVRDTSVPHPIQKSVTTTRYPEYTDSDSTKTTPVASRIEVPVSTPEAEKSFSHVFSPRKGINIPPPRSHVLVGGGGKK
jgi:hypothetical protein